MLEIVFKETAIETRKPLPSDNDCLMGGVPY